MGHHENMERPEGCEPVTPQPRADGREVQSITARMIAAETRAFQCAQALSGRDPAKLAAVEEAVENTIGVLALLGAASTDPDARDVAEAARFGLDAALAAFRMEAAT